MAEDITLGDASVTAGCFDIGCVQTIIVDQFADGRCQRQVICSGFRGTRRCGGGGCAGSWGVARGDAADNGSHFNVHAFIGNNFDQCAGAWCGQLGGDLVGFNFDKSLIGFE